MKNYSIFEVIGPIMVGPSSSHTAGAAKIGKSARNIYGKEFDSVTFYLHGSFQTTLVGHGSDRALIGGVLGMEPDDDNIVNSYDIADEKGLKYEFININLGDDVHPNTIKTVFHSDDADFYVTSSSIGGGKIKIIDINGMEVEVRGELPTVIVTYIDKLGMIIKTLEVFRDNGISIAGTTITRNGEIATSVSELDFDFTDEVLKGIGEIENVLNVVGIEKF